MLAQAQHFWRLQHCAQIKLDYIHSRCPKREKPVSSFCAMSCVITQVRQGTRIGEEDPVRFCELLDVRVPEDRRQHKVVFVYDGT